VPDIHLIKIESMQKKRLCNAQPFLYNAQIGKVFGEVMRLLVLTLLQRIIPVTYSSFPEFKAKDLNYIQW